MLHLLQVGALLLLLSDQGCLSQNLRGWLPDGLKLPCLSQWGPCLSHPPASVPPPRLSSSAPTHTPPLTCSNLMDSSLPLPSHPPLLNTYPPSAFTLPLSPPPPTSSTNSQLAAPPSKKPTPLSQS